MYVVSSFRQVKLNGQIADVVFQVAAEPPLVAVSLNCQNLTNELVRESRRFSVSILEKETPLKFIGTFGFKCGRDVDKFSGVSHRVLASGTPVILDHSLGWLDLEVVQSVELGTHTLFIGRVTASEVVKSGEPMTYAYYHQVKGGMTAKNAPTYNK
jgi:flavin reductase (DIM6/NTAB) family NADH-FMN oxidoreductase RutF